MLVSPVIITGCSAHVHAGYRVYDPYVRDYHVWGPDEDVYYRRWLGERHLEYRDIHRLRHEQQEDYWKWRHDHHEDHDRH